MSIPQPIHVALVGSSRDEIRRLRRHFRFSQPGIGPAFFAALDATPGDTIVAPADLPIGIITLWLCLGRETFEVCAVLHGRDRRMPGYDRGFYEQIFPAACVQLEDRRSMRRLRQDLSDWAHRITEAWFSTS
jgi:hypothetical protein